MKTCLKLPFIFLLFFTSGVMAQDNRDALIVSEKQTLQSQVLGESRELLIYKPGNSSQKLPLIIVFDGGGLFSATVSTLRFMNYYSEIPQMPEAIVVGIQNTDRNRDMPIPQDYSEGKGEDNFMKFVKNEVIPGMGKKYQLNGHIILVGHSQGAFFASWLLSRSSGSFPWVVALDAPMNVSPKGAAIEGMISAAVNDAKNKICYASIEAMYGWGDAWSKYFPGTDKAMTKKLTGESHESMAFPGLYEGLKFLYKDFAPAAKDMKLAELKDHYRLISQKYGYDYEIPLNILTASASRKIPENRKEEVLALLDYAESKYGTNAIITDLKTKVSGLTASAYSIVDSFLALPKPSPEQVKKYLGKWKGTTITKEGESYAYDMEISADNGKVKLLTSFDPTNPQNKMEPEVLHVTKDGKLIFGIKNRGGGIIINILDLDSKSALTGEGWWKGFTIPGDAPANVKKQLAFLINTPTRFNLVKE